VVPVAPVAQSRGEVFARMLHQIDYLIRLSRRIRHKLHQGGISRGVAYQETLYFAPIIQGFHQPAAFLRLAGRGRVVCHECTLSAGTRDELAGGELATRDWGLCSSVGVPVSVEGRLWAS
jgi:hypothetical protein